MSWSGKTHPIESFADWAAPVILAIAGAWAAKMAGVPPSGQAATGIAALFFGIALMRIAGKASPARQSGFEPAAFDAEAVQDELLLDHPLDELLLDDRLEEPDPASRVVRLFEHQDPTPGELVLRISDYLTGQGKALAPAPQAFEQQPADASEALHAALANVRANLR